MSELFSFIEDQTTRKLAETLSRLMEEEAFDAITTSDLIALSGVSRSTFYRRYLDKYDMLNKLYQRIMDDTIMKVPHGFSFRAAFYDLYHTLQSYPKFFCNALSSEGPNSLRNYILEKSFEMYDIILRREGVDLDDPFQKMLLSGYLHGSMEMTCQWAKNGMKEDVDLMLRITFELMPREMQSIMALKHM